MNLRFRFRSYLLSLALSLWVTLENDVTNSVGIHSSVTSYISIAKPVQLRTDSRLVRLTELQNELSFLLSYLLNHSIDVSNKCMINV